LSPALKTPNPGTRIGVAVGELESDEFRRQSSSLEQIIEVVAAIRLESPERLIWRS